MEGGGAAEQGERSRASGTDGVLRVVSRAAPRELAQMLRAHGPVLEVGADDALERVQEALRGDPSVRAVCLAGDASAIPFVRLPDPCGYDEALLTDAPYGMLRTPDEDERLAGQVVPDVPVTRIPTHDPAVARRLLRADAALCGDWRGGVGVSAAVWSEASTEILRGVGADVPLHLSPPRERPHVEEALVSRPGRLFFNVHGTDQDAVWLGEGDGRYPEVLRAPGVQAAPDALVVSEACYGATLRDGHDSLAPRFLREGAACFLGSTIIAWGSAPGGAPQLADELAGAFFRAIDAGLPCAEALQQARLSLLEAALEEAGGLTAPLHNTLLSFVVYGAPLLRRAPAARPEARTASGSVLAQTRERLRQRISPQAWRVVSAGRVKFASLAAQLHRGQSAAQRLEKLLGTAPTDVRLVRYQGAAGARATVLGESGHGRQVRRVAVDVDASGHVLRAYASR